MCKACHTKCNCGCRSCFPSDVKVVLENGTLRMMSKLQIGDKVQTSIKIFKF